jgi:hypothetical protein
MKSASNYIAFVSNYPDITATGLGLDYSYIQGTPEYQARWDSERALLLESYQQCKYCTEWLVNNRKTVKKRDTFGNKRNTKALKGVVEQWLRAKNVPDHYITQGAFIIAAFSEGYVIDEIINGGPNVTLK